MASVSDLYICSTYYHVYISLIKVLINKKKSDIVICDDIPEHHRLMASLIKSKCFYNVYFFERASITESFGRNKLDWLLFQHKRNKKQIEKAFKLDVDRYKDVYIYHDDIILGRYLQDVKKKYCLIEDSRDFFKTIDQTQFVTILPPKNPSLKYKLKRALNAGYYPMGASKFVTQTEVNDEQGIIIPYQNLVQRPYKDYISKLSCDNKKLIYHIFSYDDIDLAFSNNNALLLTQPLFYDGYVGTENEQIRVYKHIVENLATKGYDVVIKPHPRDSLNYLMYFPCCIILNKNIPIEILNFNEKIAFSVAITIFSSSVNNIEFANKKIILGMGYIQEQGEMGDL